MEEIVITKDEMLGWLERYKKHIAPTDLGPGWFLCSCNGTWIKPLQRYEQFRLRGKVHSYDYCGKPRNKKTG